MTRPNKSFSEQKQTRNCFRFIHGEGLIPSARRYALLASEASGVIFSYLCGFAALRELFSSYLTLTKITFLYYCIYKIRGNKNAKIKLRINGKLQ